MSAESSALGAARRLRVRIRGAVQGVGFRPFTYRLAQELRLSGWVNNSTQGVTVEVEGPAPDLQQFLLRLEREKPPRSSIQSLEPSWLDPAGYSGFEIRPSESGGAKTALVLPDIATCPDCQREIFDPQNRRFQYPFTNCTNCGPRFSIIEALPYDRGNTSMKQFTMCPLCQAEYDDPLDRRFHAQPNACPVCGPHLELRDHRGSVLTGESAAALDAAAEAIRAGRIVAVKGLGGFQLMADAGNDPALNRLRERKHREEKPFALMFPYMDAVRCVCEVSALEERLLRSPESPIVLLRRRAPRAAELAPAVAPGNPNLGVMLPYTPMHHLLLARLGAPVVATSGNLSDEPICIGEREALERLGNIADLFLVHNRPIVRHVDDSVARIVLDRESVLRRARGYAPLPVRLPTVTEDSAVLAVGAHLKNTVALSVGPQVFISQHIGDLENEPSYNAFEGVIRDFEKLYERSPSVVAADLHPDYLSTRYAVARATEIGSAAPDTAQGPRLKRVQHHLAHVLSCMAENEIEPPLLGVSWDGTGYGLDGTIWGGEFFLVAPEGAERRAHLRPFRLPGSAAAVKEPRRTAMGVLFEMFGPEAFEMRDVPAVNAFSAPELSSIRTMIVRHLNSPVTSSVGRLFDAVASIAGLRHQVRFEAQAAMELEFALEGIQTDEVYALELRESVGTVPMLDWSVMVKALLDDVRAGMPIGKISAKFHNGLVEGILAVARHLGRRQLPSGGTSPTGVLLSGGCFQNRYLLERAVRRLGEEGFRPYWHQRVPPNDGGISLGQVVATVKGY
jgi:hydrogenase maturation protein HypF